MSPWKTSLPLHGWRLRVHGSSSATVRSCTTIFASRSARGAGKLSHTSSSPTRVRPVPCRDVELTAPDYVVLIVDDVARSIEFYRDVLGLKLGHRSGQYAQFDTGTTRLALYDRVAMADTLGRALTAPDAGRARLRIGFQGRVV